MIHKKGVVHADLKPSNILLKGRDYDITICDFGISQKLPRGTHLANQFIGSMCYCSPEVLRGEPFNSKTDITFGRWAASSTNYAAASVPLKTVPKRDSAPRSSLTTFPRSRNIPSKQDPL